MELERIRQLANSIEDEAGKQAVLDAEETIADTFSQMIRYTAMFMIDGTRPKHDLSAATDALRLLHEQGRAHGIEFPAPESDDTVKKYIIHYGAEVVWGGDNAQAGCD